MATDPLSLPTDTTPLIVQGDALRSLRRMPADSVHCIVSSYPYYGLRDYGRCSCGTPPDPSCELCGGSGRIGMETVWDEPSDPCDHAWETTYSYWDNRHAASLAAEGADALGSTSDHRGKVGSTRCARCGAWKGAFGLEPSVELYVAHAVAIGEELRRVLRPDGVFWLNLGDSYSGAGRGPQGGLRRDADPNVPEPEEAGVPRVPEGLKPKDLVGVPWRVAFAYQAAGWYLRCDVIWSKPNPMPESVRDRPSRSHEYVFLLTKRERYFYDADAVRTELSAATVRELAERYEGVARKAYEGTGAQDPSATKTRIVDGIRRRTAELGLKQFDGIRNDGSPSAVEARILESKLGSLLGANLKSVWTIPTKPYREAHFATFPPGLVERCVKAGTSAFGSCSRCGAPYARRYEETGETVPAQDPGGPNAARLDRMAVESQDRPLVKAGGESMGARTLPRSVRVDRGPAKTCACDGSERVPCLVLDPFNGSGTTCLVARHLGRRSVGLELNPLYVELARDRVGRFRSLESWS